MNPIRDYQMTQTLTGPGMFRTVLFTGLVHVVFLVVAAVVIGWVATWWMLGAKVGVWLYLAWIAVNGLHLVFIVLLPALLMPLLVLWRRDVPIREYLREEMWLWLCTLTKCVVLFIALVGLGYVATAVGYLVSS